MGITKGRNDSSDLGVYPWFQLNFNSLEIMFIKYHHDVKSNMLKSYFLGQCSFTQVFHYVEQLRRKPKNICEGYTNILVCTTGSLNCFFLIQ